MNKKKITSVALAFTLAVAAPVKANLINLDFGVSRVVAAAANNDVETTKAAYEAAVADEKAVQQEVEETEAEVTKTKAAYDEAKQKAEAEAADEEAKAKVTETEGAYEAAVAAQKEAQKRLTEAQEKVKTTKAAYDEAKQKAEAADEEAAKNNAKSTLEAAIATAKQTLQNKRAENKYTDTSINGFNKLITEAETLKVKPTATVEEMNAKTKALNEYTFVEKTAPVATTVRLDRPTVYYNKVSGKTDPYATVTLKRNGITQDSTTADSYGNYTIYHNFGRYNNTYYNGYYGTASVRNYGSTYVDGYTSSNTYVEAVNNGVVVGSGYSNSSGYYSINFNRTVSNPSATTVYTNRYNGYYNDRYYYYNDLADYTLEATKAGMNSASYNLRNAYTDNYYNYNYGYRYQDPIYNYAYAATVTSATPGSSVVTGRGLNSYASVSVYDSNNVRLGSATALSDGTFTVSLNRNLRAGETISVTSSYSNYRNNTVTYKVAGTEAKTSTYNYTVTMTIGARNLTTVKDGVTTNTTMDTEAYIKDGRTMLPIRYVAQALGYNVTWNDVTRTASFSDGKRIVILNVDSSEFYVDGVKNTFSVAPEIKDGRTMLPISDIGKALGMTTGNKGDNKNIEWDSVLRQVKIQLTK